MKKKIIISVSILSTLLILTVVLCIVFNKHNFIYLNNNHKHWKYCTHCGKISKENNHIFDAEVTLTNATTTSYGTKVKVCDVCDYVKYETTPMLSAEPENGNDSRKDDYSYKVELEEKMPQIHIDTASGTTDFATKYNFNDKQAGLVDYEKCAITVKECDASYALENIDCNVKVRGNYTLTYDKKPIRLKFEKKQSLLGLNNGNKYKSWVLLADYKDSSMQYNSTAFYLGNLILGSDGYYCTDFKNVEVYINGEYWGVYLLCEQQQVNENRVEIFEPEDGYEGTDIGYLFEYDGYAYQEDISKGGDYTFAISLNNNAKIKNYNGDWVTPFNRDYTIKSDTYSQAQRGFLKNYLETAYSIIYNAVYNQKYYKFNETYTDKIESSETDVVKVISSVIDIKSLVDVYVLHEICCDVDVIWSSFYLSVDMSNTGNKLLTFQAPWDFDSAFGSKGQEDAKDIYAGNSKNPWLTIFSNCNWFKDMVKVKWNELVEYDVLTKVLHNIQETKNLYKDYYNKNHEHWRTSGDPTGEFGQHIKYLKTQEESSDRLYFWLIKRFAYLNKYFSS